ncbi:hypothetical protein [Hyphomicrobium sp.]|jgi:hypothetical protein|uniref:hypothetical protein n=1 Tax=Hyphomicrobium sp. TaxID=82 RepID=UPI002FDF1FA1
MAATVFLQGPNLEHDNEYEGLDEWVGRTKNTTFVLYLSDTVVDMIDYNNTYPELTPKCDDGDEPCICVFPSEDENQTCAFARYQEINDGGGRYLIGLPFPIDPASMLDLLRSTPDFADHPTPLEELACHRWSLISHDTEVEETVIYEPSEEIFNYVRENTEEWESLAREFEAEDFDPAAKSEKDASPNHRA